MTNNPKNNPLTLAQCLYNRRNDYANFSYDFYGSEDAALDAKAAVAIECMTNALRPLSAIFEAWEKDGLDEDRPDWRARNIGTILPFDKVELFSGRGGKQLLTLADAKRAFDALAGVDEVSPLNSRKAALDTSKTHGYGDPCDCQHPGKSFHERGSYVCLNEPRSDEAITEANASGHLNIEHTIEIIAALTPNFPTRADLEQYARDNPPTKQYASAAEAREALTPKSDKARRDFADRLQAVLLGCLTKHGGYMRNAMREAVQIVFNETAVTAIQGPETKVETSLNTSERVAANRMRDVLFAINKMYWETPDARVDITVMGPVAFAIKEYENTAESTATSHPETLTKQAAPTGPGIYWARPHSWPGQPEPSIRAVTVHSVPKSPPVPVVWRPSSGFVDEVKIDGPLDLVYATGWTWYGPVEDRA